MYCLLYAITRTHAHPNERASKNIGELDNGRLEVGIGRETRDSLSHGIGVATAVQAFALGYPDRAIPEGCLGLTELLG